MWLAVAIVLGVLATLVTGEWSTSWGFVLVDIPLVALCAAAGFSLARWQAWLLVPVVWLMMLAWSKPWLDRFNYGPLEWAWRSLARGKLQPMRKRKFLPAAA